MKTMLILLMLPLLCFSEESLLDGLRGCSPKKEVTPRIEKYKFPEAVFKIQEVTGSYSEKKIKAVTDSNMLSLRSIYYKYLLKKLDFEGDILLKFTISGNGKVSNIDILSSTTGNAEFDEAVKNKVATWKWESTGSGNVTSVTVLFKFSILFSLYKSFTFSGPHPLIDILRNFAIILPGFQSLRSNFNKLKPLSGRLILKFTVTENRITEVDIMASTTEYPEFDEAIKNELAAFKWKTYEGYSEKGSTTIISECLFDPP